jgi:O-antigen/teichoic acid export membrane protein
MQSESPSPQTGGYQTASQPALWESEKTGLSKNREWLEFDESSTEGTVAVQDPRTGLDELGTKKGGSRFAAALNWAKKAGYAVTDQGLIAGSNFVLGILLARWLSPGQYGAYALGFSVYLLLVLLYQSLVSEPMVIFGGSTYRDCLRGYLKKLLGMHAALAVVTFLALGSAAFIAHAMHQPDGLPGALAGTAIAAPCILLLWLVRPAFYLHSTVGYSALGSFVYCCLLLSGLYTVYHFGYLSAFTAFLLMGFAASITGGFLLLRMRGTLQGGRPAPKLSVIWHKHWIYGRWALAGCLAGWVPAYVYYPLLSAFQGTAHAGELKALMNFDLPIQHAYGAMSILLMPYAARMRMEGGKATVAKIARTIIVLFFLAACAYWALIIPFRSQIFHVLYSDKYNAVTYLLPILALESIFSAAIYGPGIILRSMESPASVFWARSAASVVSLTIGIIGTRTFGLQGALWTMVLSAIAALGVALVILRRKLRVLSN